MNIGDLRAAVEDLPDSTEIVVCEEKRALWVCGLGAAKVGPPATFADSDLAVVRGSTVFEITVRDKP